MMTESQPITSFRKKGTEVPRIPGTRVSYHNAQLLTSTGISSLDFHLGGGIAVGTVLLIQEDDYHIYSTLLSKYFISEGMANGHSVLLASGDVPCDKILKELPSIVPLEPVIPYTASSDELKIAWRYKDQKFQQGTRTSFCHSFDLSKPMPSADVEKAKLTLWNPSKDQVTSLKPLPFIVNPYASLLQRIKTEIDNQHLSTSQKSACTTLLRIAICSLGSPLWHTEDVSSQDCMMFRFLYSLRALLRTSFCVAVVTVPQFVIQNKSLCSKLRQMSDYVIKLDALFDIERKNNNMLKDFDGLINITKLPILNTFMYQLPPSDLGFKLRRKHFQIECLHLPPDVEDSKESTSMACGGQGKLMDF